VVRLVFEAEVALFQLIYMVTSHDSLVSRLARPLIKSQQSQRQCVTV